MKSNTGKLISIGLLVPFTGLAIYMVMQLQAAVNEVPDRLIPETEHKGGEHGAPTADAHGAPAADAHGAPAADAHGAPAADAHGAPAADAHGAPAADEHGGGHGESAAADTARTPASVGLFSVDEVFVNVGFGDNVKSLGLKIELEIFEESSRKLFEQSVSGIRHTVIEASRQQDADRLQTVSGKLYFKEYLVGRLNGFFNKPVVREVHFSSFYLQ